jgi:hypothetical protein
MFFFFLRKICTIGHYKINNVRKLKAAANRRCDYTKFARGSSSISAAEIINHRARRSSKITFAGRVALTLIIYRRKRGQGT